MEDAFAHCERLVREADRDRFLAALFAPGNRRRQLFALYAFNVEVARIRERIRDPLAGEVRLQWWHDVVGGERAAEAAGHPVAAALVQTVVRRRLPPSALTDLIAARRFDLYNEPMQSLAQLEDYARKTSSSLMQLAALILDDSNPQMTAATAAPAGTAYAMSGLLRAFPLHASRGQLYMPLELLNRHGARQEDIFAGRDTPALRAALAGMRARIEEHLGDCARAAALPAAVLPAFLPVALVGPYLQRLKRTGPFRIAEVPQWRRQWILWRAARRGQAISES